MKPRLRTAIKVIYCALFSVAVAVVVDYVLYLRWKSTVMARLRPEPTLSQASAATGLPESLLHSIGRFRPDPRRDFRTVPRARGEHIRVGAFGDSMTFGNEVAAGLDFPSLLGRRFREAGFENVEVLNFASPWHGFAQAFRLWEQFGQNYDLGFILLGPSGFDPRIDERFNHTDDQVPDYLHGRYVLDGESVRFVDVIGSLESYYRFIPRRDYLRYDRTLPSFIRSVLPGDLEVDNPFYYLSLSEEKEGEEIYARLFAKLVARSQVILLHKLPEIAAIGERMPSRMVAHPIPTMQGFPWRRPHDHLSGAGNLVIADAFFAVLSGEESAPFYSFTFTPPAADTRASNPESLARFTGARLMLGTQVAGVLVLVPTSYEERVDAPVDFKALRVKSLLALVPKGVPLSDCVFLPLEVQLEPGMSLEMELSIGGHPRKFPLGAIRFSSGDISIAHVETNALSISRSPITVTQELNVGALGLEPAKVEAGRILLDGNAIYEINRDPDTRKPTLRSTGKRTACLAPLESTLLDVGALPAKGDVRLVLSGPAPREIPFGRFGVTKQSLVFRRDGLRQIIRRSDRDPKLGVIAPAH